MEEYSFGKEAAEFASTFINNNLKGISKVARDTVNLAGQEVRVRLDRTYREYLECVSERYSKVKTFLFNQQSVELRKFYVPLGIRLKITQYPEVTFSDITLTNNFNIITGIAGSGKSMMMRYLFLDSIKNTERIPVFIELRDLNQSGKSLLDFFKEKLADNKFDLGEKFIDRAIELGYFVIFLDGFDELTEIKRQEVAESIEKLSKRSERNQIIISSRPDDFFNKWEDFRVWSISELTLDKACQLIDNLPYDKDIKHKFIKDLKNKLFKEHQYFLSNPLLLTIMWLCYGDHAEIPKKFSLFYQQAYEALFNKHDARKGGFQRSRKTSLDIQEFATVFSILAIQTFDNGDIVFNETKAIEYLNKAKEISNIAFNTKDFLIDSIKAVCLILEDGLNLRFTHRSFQEYFAAVFILNSPDEIQRKLLAKYSFDNFQNNNVLDLTFSINQDAVEKHFIIPEIEELEKQLDLKADLKETDHLQFMKLEFSHVRLSDTILKFLYQNNKYGFMVNFLEEYYNELVPKSIIMTEKENEEHQLQLTDTMSKDFNIAVNQQITMKRFLSKDKTALLYISGDYSLRLPFLINVKNYLVSKHRSRKESLEEILGIGQNKLRSGLRKLKH